MLALFLVYGAGAPVSLWTAPAALAFTGGAILWILGARQAGHAARVGAGDPQARRRRDLYLAGAVAAFALMALFLELLPQAS